MLLGLTVLEQLGLAVGPVQRRLVRTYSRVESPAARIADRSSGCPASIVRTCSSTVASRHGSL